jgi:clan AA aspartic protease
MISGTVSSEREIIVDLEVVTAAQAPMPIQAVVDTGFNGYLTLPASTLKAAGALSAGTRRAELGDGQIVDLELFLLKVKWLAEEREILAVRADAAPLLGMSMLWGCRVAFAAETGGTVMIDPLP